MLDRHLQTILHSVCLNSRLRMIELRPASELGGADFGWLKALHHFHVGAHSNSAHKALGNLYVWNDDDIAPGMGFPLHRHREVEIITYVRQGRILHRDSLGNVGRIASGDVQVMSAGTGIAHEEVAMPDQWARVFQIWLQLRERGGPPRWGTRSFPKAGRVGRLVTLASGFAEDVGALHDPCGCPCTRGVAACRPADFIQHGRSRTEGVCGDDGRSYRSQRSATGRTGWSSDSRRTCARNRGTF